MNFGSQNNSRTGTYYTAQWGVSFICCIAHSVALLLIMLDFKKKILPTSTKRLINIQSIRFHKISWFAPGALKLHSVDQISHLSVHLSINKRIFSTGVDQNENHQRKSERTLHAPLSIAKNPAVSRQPTTYFSLLGDLSIYKIASWWTTSNLIFVSSIQPKRDTHHALPTGLVRKHFPCQVTM